jgi:hypothetical protein
MATSKKKLEGALSLTAPSEEDTTDYNAEMQGLIGQLVQSPEDLRRDELTAWGGGLTDPSGNGSIGASMVNANKSLADQRIKDRTLRTSYVPMIMNALMAQQQNNQLARLDAAAMSDASGGAGGSDLIGMDPNKLPAYARIKQLKLPDVVSLWKEANKPDAMQGGTMQRFAKPGGGFTERWIADPKTPVVVGPNNEISVAPGGADAQAQLAGRTSQASEAGKRFFDTLEGTAPDGTPYKTLLLRQFPELFQGYAGAPQKPAPMGGPTPTPGPAGGGAPAGGSSRPTAPPMGGAQPQPRNSAGIDPSQWRGNFEGNPQSIAAAIAKIYDPVEREQAMAGFENQMRGRNPAYRPNGSEPPANPMQGAAPVVTAGLPEGAIQTGMSPAKKMELENLSASNKLFTEKMYPDVLTAGGKVADERLTAIAQARQAMKELGQTGWTSETKLKGAQILGGLGVKQAQEYAASGETFQRAVYENNFQGLSLQNGVQTEGDAQRYAKTFASLGNTAKANALVFDTSEAIARRDKMKADFFAKALPIAQKTGDLQEVQRRWMKIAPPIIDMPSMRRWKSVWKE